MERVFQVSDCSLDREVGSFPGVAHQFIEPCILFAQVTDILEICECIFGLLLGQNYMLSFVALFLTHDDKV